MEEFIFGGYETYQRSLSWIESKAGISFGDLTAADPLARGVETMPAALSDFSQIQFA